MRRKKENNIYLIGALALEVALRAYMYHKYPLLPPLAMMEACKWFSSPVAAARFAKFLKFDGILSLPSPYPSPPSLSFLFSISLHFIEMVTFKFETPTINVESDYAAYRLLEPAERVSLLATTYPLLLYFHIYSYLICFVCFIFDFKEIYRVDRGYIRRRRDRSSTPHRRAADQVGGRIEN